MSNLSIAVYPSKEALSKHVRSILITTATNLSNDIIPIGPTGFSYFTYSRFPVRITYSHGTMDSDEQLYLVGQLDNELPYFTIDGNFFHVGLELYPTSMSYFFNLEGKEILDNGILLQEKYPMLAEQLRHRLSSVESPLAVAEVLQEVLIDRMSDIEPIDFLDNAMQLIFREHGNIRIDELAAHANVSERHFRRTFKQVVGIGPKKYCKIIQFNAVFEAIRSGNEEQLMDLMLANGYYDQAHFINDFKSYLGQSPTEFLNSGHSFLKSYLGSVRS
jgi:AraC-like DNA-binding protein